MVRFLLWMGVAVTTALFFYNLFILFSWSIIKLGGLI